MMSEVGDFDKKFMSDNMCVEGVNVSPAEEGRGGYDGPWGDDGALKQV
jgi:hypothetical protein